MVNRSGENHGSQGQADGVHGLMVSGSCRLLMVDANQSLLNQLGIEAGVLEGGIQHNSAMETSRARPAAQPNGPVDQNCTAL